MCKESCLLVVKDVFLSEVRKATRRTADVTLHTINSMQKFHHRRLLQVGDGHHSWPWCCDDALPYLGALKQLISARASARRVLLDVHEEKARHKNIINTDNDDNCSIPYESNNYSRKTSRNTMNQAAWLERCDLLTSAIRVKHV